MRMISGSVIILAAAVFAAGYKVAQAHNGAAVEGSPLPFLAWACGLGGLYLLAHGWMDETKAGEKPEKKK